MKRLNQFLVSSGIAALVCLSNRDLAAQDQPPPRGNFDPAQFRQRMLDRYKERLEVTSDDEWKLIQDRIEKGTQLQRDLRIGGKARAGRPRAPRARAVPPSPQRGPARADSPDVSCPATAHTRG